MLHIPGHFVMCPLHFKVTPGPSKGLNNPIPTNAELGETHHHIRTSPKAY
jgi:hypothetical protein